MATKKTDAGVRVRVIKFYGVKVIEQEIEAKIGVFLYWKDPAALKRLKAESESNRRGIFEESQPKFLLPDLTPDSPQPEIEDLRMASKEGPGQDTFYSYTSCAGRFRITFHEPEFPCNPPIQVPLRVKLKDNRYKLVPITEFKDPDPAAFTGSDLDQSLRSCIAGKDVMSVQGWSLKGLPFSQKRYSDASDNVLLWKESQNPTAYMEEEHDGEGFHSLFTAKFLVERHSNIYIIQFVVPSSLLTFLAFFTFILPANEFHELRISTCTTLLLTLLSLQLAISTVVPNTGRTTFLDRKMMCSFNFIFAIMIVQMLEAAEVLSPYHPGIRNVTSLLGVVLWMMESWAVYRIAARHGILNRFKVLGRCCCFWRSPMQQRKIASSSTLEPPVR